MSKNQQGTVLRLLEGFPVLLQDTEDAGRIVIASKDLEEGELILASRPSGITIYETYSERWCFECTGCSPKALRFSCAKCGAHFCSKACEKAANEAVHAPDVCEARRRVNESVAASGPGQHWGRAEAELLANPDALTQHSEMHLLLNMLARRAFRERLVHSIEHCRARKKRGARSAQRHTPAPPSTPPPSKESCADLNSPTCQNTSSDKDLAVHVEEYTPAAPIPDEGAPGTCANTPGGLLLPSSVGLGSLLFACCLPSPGPEDAPRSEAAAAEAGGGPRAGEAPLHESGTKAGLVETEVGGLGRSTTAGSAQDAAPGGCGGPHASAFAQGQPPALHNCPADDAASTSLAGGAGRVGGAGSTVGAGIAASSVHVPTLEEGLALWRPSSELLRKFGQQQKEKRMLDAAAKVVQVAPDRLLQGLDEGRLIEILVDALVYPPPEAILARL
ncbi:hypothetical protein CYMTET_30595 [Cymbomonas tetramitiformis]|uniref:Uncharacterized protein n=1 Tax=Cymbomonas tetramitiformis TaxID=36881 RepID=A0AAE0FJ47_9CHLO|nr:hypothetical protein CYMTET_30595 [Cymbomonas tetramitiformis]